MEPTTTSVTVVHVSPLSWILAIVFAVLMIVALWKVFEKAGKPGWAAIVPFYNTYVLFQVAGYNGWMFLLMLIPFVNFVMTILVSLGVAKNFGRSAVFGIFGLWIFSFIGYLMLGFGKDKYLGGSFEPSAPAAAPAV